MEIFTLYPAQIAVASLFIGIVLGSLTTLFLNHKQLTLAQHVAVLFLAFYMLMYLGSKLFLYEIEIFIHAGGLASLGTLTGVKTSEFFANLFGRK